MNRSVRTLALSALLVQAGLTLAASAAPATAPRLPAQLAMEKWFVGCWICEGTQHASPEAPAVKFTDRFTFKMALEDSWLSFQIDQVKGPLQGKRTLIGWGTWDENAKLHIRRDMNIGGSRLDMTTLGWSGDTLVFTGQMIAGEEKLPVKQTFTRKGDGAYDSSLLVTGADGRPVAWESETCKRVRK